MVSAEPGGAADTRPRQHEGGCKHRADRHQEAGTTVVEKGATHTLATPDTRPAGTPGNCGDRPAGLRGGGDSVRKWFDAMGLTPTLTPVCGGPELKGVA
jgi:hypothetical protein